MTALKVINESRTTILGRQRESGSVLQQMFKKSLELKSKEGVADSPATSKEVAANIKRVK